MGTDKHEAKKQEILESTFRIWGKCRFQNTSLSELAAAHNMTKQALYRYYPSKARLEEAMETAAMERYKEAVENLKDSLQGSGPDDFPIIFLKGTVDFMKKNGAYVAFLSFRYRQDEFGPPHMHRFLSEITTMARDRANIPGVGIRYLNAIALIEGHSRDGHNWERVWNEGFSTSALKSSPHFDRLLSDASLLDYSAFGDDPLIRAVFETVMEEAGSGVSMGKVARKAGLTKSSLYNYWPSKEAMLSGVLSRQITVFSRMFDEYASAYSEPTDRLFAYLAFTGTFFRRTPEILNYMQRVMSFGIEPPKDMQLATGGFFQSLSTVIDAGVINLGDYDAFTFLGLVNLAAVNEIKYHLVEGSARIHIDQCMKDLYLLISGGISALRRTM